MSVEGTARVLLPRRHVECEEPEDARVVIHPVRTDRPGRGLGELVRFGELLQIVPDRTGVERVADLLALERHAAGVDAAEDVERHLRRRTRLDDVHDELRFVDPPLHGPRQVVMAQAVELAAVLEPGQGKFALHVAADGREPLNAVDHRPLLVRVRRDVEDRNGNAQQERFDQPALLLGVPDAGHALKVGRQIDLVVLHPRQELTDQGRNGAHLDLRRIERVLDRAAFRILPLFLDAARIGRWRFRRSQVAKRLFQGQIGLIVPSFVIVEGLQTLRDCGGIALLDCLLERTPRVRRDI